MVKKKDFGHSGTKMVRGEKKEHLKTGMRLEYGKGGMIMAR
tara:strand:+ start:150 stop:272 length:123 start_codon:yes stop_codon:yes gene_type:complete